MAKTATVVDLREAQGVERDVPIADIETADQLIRADEHDEGIIELAADIVANGLLQAIGVRPRADGRLELLFGKRRLLAHLRLRRLLIRARVFPASDAPVKAIAIRENILRAPMSLEEECSAVASLHLEEHKSPEEIASLLSKSRAWVLSRLTCGNFPEFIKVPVFERLLSVGAAELIAALTDEGAQRYIVSQAVQNRLSVAAVSQLVEAFKASTASTEPTDGAGAGSAIAPQPVVIKMACAQCGAERPLAELVIVRVCGGECASDPNSHP